MRHAILLVLLSFGAEAAFASVLAKRHEVWLQEVEVLITAEEEELFLSLSRDYHRDSFIREFWRVRDPYPQTARNELKERYDERVEFSRSNFGSLRDARAEVYLAHGEPTQRVEVRCSATRSPAEIWLYVSSEQVNFRFLIVFVRQRDGAGLAKVWLPGDSSIQRVLSVTQACANGELLRGIVESALNQGADYGSRVSLALRKRRPKQQEWVAAFEAGSTDLPAEAREFPAELSWDVKGRRDSRTVVEGTLEVDTAELVIGEFAGYRSYDLVAIGEVVRGGELFETFRYKYGFPVDEPIERLQMPFQRYLRPGDEYQVVVRLEDLHGARFARVETTLPVPQAEGDVRPLQEQLGSELLEEAVGWLESDEPRIRLVRPEGELQTGFVRLSSVVGGPGVEQVAFWLDDELFATRTRPPFHLEMDFGSFPRPHVVRAEALDGAGSVLAVDEMVLNGGRHRFAARFVSPRPGAEALDRVDARVDVEVPEGRSVERVEFFFNEDLVATVFQEPFTQPVPLPSPAAAGFVRAVAYLVDGNSTEAVVFVNSDDLSEALDVQFVELYATAQDRAGRPLRGLGQSTFRVEEDGVQQTISRFAEVEDLPIHVGVLLDNSASMAGALDSSRKAALRFFQQAIRPRDRAAVITFNRFPSLAVKLTSDLRELGGGLAGVSAEGQTALYDSVMFGLYYFAGVTGQKALLLLSDGKDEVSRFSYEETLQYARRAGVALYTIGLSIDEGSARRKLEGLAADTGGRSFFLKDIEALDEVYTAIQEELRSQYLIAYQSSNASGEDTFRRVEVKSRQGGVEVKTMAGYYP